MANTDFDTIIDRSLQIRERYHELKLQHHCCERTVEEDALAFLTDAGLVGSHKCRNSSHGPKLKKK